jgi:hypothetical protein
MEHCLETLSHKVDGLLIQHGYGDRVAGGYVARNDVLLSLTGTAFVDADTIYNMELALECQIKATVGVLLLNNPPLDHVEYEVLALPAPEPVPTMDIMELIGEAMLS